MTRKELLEKAKPILFNTEMVKAILDGRKTVTRRVVGEIECIKVKRNARGRIELYDATPNCGVPKNVILKPPYAAGDYLYVRETWNHYTYDNVSSGVHKAGYFYKASPEMKKDLPSYTQDHWGEKWKPSIHMPKEAARIFLKVTDVKAELLRDITEEQAKKEGVAEEWITLRWKPTPYIPNVKDYPRYVDTFVLDIWEPTIKKADLRKYGWNANPWVWVIEFEKINET